MTPVSGTIYPLVDRILDGKLAEELKRRRERGDSLLTIVRWLDSEHGVSVSVETVRTCGAEIDEPDGRTLVVSLPRARDRGRRVGMRAAYRPPAREGGLVTGRAHLVEVLVVLAIMAVCAGITVHAVLDFAGTAARVTERSHVTVVVAP